MTKKILIITDNMVDQVNGVVTTYNNIKLQARAHGYSVEFIDPSQFLHVSCPGYPEVKLSWPQAMGSKIQAINPDYVHIATEGPLGVAAKLWLDRHEWKYNTSYHTKWADFLKKIYYFPQAFSWIYLRWFHKKSAHVMTTTPTMVTELKNHRFGENVCSWTRGVDRAKLVPTTAHFQNSTPCILYVGRLSKEKTLDDLCCLSDHYQITVVGDGPDRSRLERLYPAVNFVGYKKGQELANYYITADVFAFPSQTDTFGIVMIESMSLGTPIAAYPVAGPIDIVEVGINGFLDWDLENAIKQCLQLDRQAVAKSSEKWTWEQCWQIFEEYLVKT